MADTGGAPGEAEDYLLARALVESVTPSGDYDGAARSLERLCRAAVENLDLLGASVHLLADGSAGVFVAADGTPARLGDIEFDAGDGPGATAVALNRPVLVSNLAGPFGDEWPGYRHGALELGVASVFVFPLHLGAVAFGTLELLSGRVGALSREHARLARRFAAIGVEILLDGDLTDSAGELSGGLERAFANRADIAQAQGMVMVDLGVTLGEAIARMRAHAFASEMALSELARKVIDGYVLPSGDGPTTGGESLPRSGE